MKRWLGENRIFLLLGVVLIGMSAISPAFFTWPTFTIALQGVSINALLATGFTIVLITRQLDLSIGATLTLGAMITAGLQPHWGWWTAIGAALACGLAIGTVNGWLVAKAKVDSFITTLGTLIIVTGIGLKYSHGGTLFIQDFAASDWLDRSIVANGPFQAFSSPLVLIAFAVVLGTEAFLKWTPRGRAFYMVGGNPQTAFYAGLPVHRLLIDGFILSGLMSALGGALTAVQLNAAEPGIGTPSLMTVIAAVIVGGTSMQGGKGSVFKSLVALLTINLVAVGMNRLGAGSDVINIANGVMLGAIILYEAIQTARQRRIKGRRPELMARLKDDFGGTQDPAATDEESNMQHKDNSLAIICITAMACVAMVAMALMYLQHRAQPIIVPATSAGQTANTARTTASASPTTSSKVDVTRLKATDGQPLLPKPEIESIPPRPADPSALPKTDAGHWYDEEYAVWNVKRAPLLPSPGDGPRGKRVIYLKYVDHPYLTAYTRGMRIVADAYGVKLTVMSAEDDTNKQKTQVDEVVNMKPDLVIFNAVSPKASIPLLRELYNAAIPVIASNQLISREGLKYTLAWTGPDDWGQFRMLSRKFAELMHDQGGYVIVRHFPGNSCYDSRTWSAITELKMVAPKMKLLAMQTTDLDMIKTEKVVSGWLTRFGKQLKGIISADDSAAQLGIDKACQNAGRNDIIRVAAGNSKVGMEAIQSGQLNAITYQSPEADGAVPMYLAVQWFSGKKIPTVQYLPKRLITAKNVKDFLPPQW